MDMDFTRICRICLIANKQAFDIFTCYYLKRNTLYSEMLSSCTRIKPYQDDGLPRLICKECCRQLKRTYTFNVQCEESDKKLKLYIENKADVFTNENLIKSEDEMDIKYVDDSIKDENEDERKSLITILENNIKLEPRFMNEGERGDSWDAEDDNILLEDIKTSKQETLKALDKEFKEREIESIEQPKEQEVDGIKTKKKRGRKKRVFLEGVLPPLPESKLPHQCDICGKFLSTKSNLKAHKICHTNLRPYKCPECPASFRGHSALFQHKKVHSGETPYHCEFCPKQFSRRTGLVNHIRMHTGEKQYSCEVCFKSFVQSAQLSIHMRRHKGDKPYLCQDCGKGFPIKADLKVHQRIHNGEKPYSCHLCAKTFATSGNLSIHVRIHNKEIRYRCKECSRGFVTCSAFNVHMKRHKGQRDYHCECGKTFYTSSALKQHRVVHTGEKKYQCKICFRKFTQTSHLSRHFKRDHAKPNAPVPSSDHYKLVLNDDASKLFGVEDTEKLNNGVKCEGS